MTNPNLTHIVAILDRSGSMFSIREDTESGFNAFIEEQKKTDGDCFVTLVQFDNDYEVVYESLPLADVPNLELVPRGSTALLDAIGKAVTQKGAELAKLPESERPGSVVVVVLTDGFENSSREWNKSRIRELLIQQQSVYSWNFIFMGSNQDAVLAGKDLGFLGSNSLTYTGVNTNSAFASAARSVSTYRASTAAGLSYGEGIIAAAFTEDERAEAVSDSVDEPISSSVQ